MLLSFIKYFNIRICMLKTCLIYFPTCIKYTFLFILTACLMINWKLAYNLALLWTHYSPTISNICNIKHISIKKGYNSTGTRTIQSSIFRMLNKSFLTLLKPIFQCSLHTIRKTKILKYIPFLPWNINM